MSTNPRKEKAPTDENQNKWGPNNCRTLFGRRIHNADMVAMVVGLPPPQDCAPRRAIWGLDQISAHDLNAGKLNLRSQENGHLQPYLAIWQSLPTYCSHARWIVILLRAG
jgi:hypothetical protein